jgi:hypothetical protein
MPLRRVAAIALFVSLFLFSPVRADDQTSALINQALDKKVEQMSLNALLPAALDQITQQTGVPVKADPAVWDLLPWGRETNIKAKIENQPLRETFDAITRKLGLRWELKNDQVVVEPVGALRRLARRATVQELGCIDTLMGVPFDQNGSLTVKDVLDAVDAKLASSKSQYVIDRPSADVGPLDMKVEVPRNATAFEALNKVAAQTQLTWYPWGKSVVVLPKSDEVRRQLQRTVTARYNGVDVTQVLQELSQKAGVRFDIEPGAVQQIAPESRSIRLVLDDYSIQSALDSLSGVTGLDYTVKGDSVYVWNQNPNNTGVPRDRILITMPVRGTDVTVWIPESQVPSDIREYVKQKQAKSFEDIRQMMREEGFKPSTPPGPTTKPAAKKDTNQDL